MQYPGKTNAVPNQGKRGKWRFFYKFLRYKMFVFILKGLFRDFPGGAVVKNPPANAGDTGSSPGPVRSHMPRSN